MEYQSFGRPMRAKGANIKQALKMILVVAVCAWLVYQIKHSRNKTENYGGQTGINVEVYNKAIVSLGRKGNPSWFHERRAFPDSGNVVDSADAEILSTGRDDDEFDVANEDKAEEEFVHTNDKFGTDERKQVEDEKSRKVPMETVREPPNEVQIRKNSEESVRRNASMTEDLIDESLMFHDENGVPPDGNENEILLVGQQHILHEDNNVQVKLEGLKSDATAYEEEINTGTIIHVDTSGINRSSEISEGESLVS